MVVILEDAGSKNAVFFAFLLTENRCCNVL